MKDNLKQLFTSRLIAYRLYKHPKIYTIEDAKNITFTKDIFEIKNLFLRNQNKSEYYLFSLPADSKLSLAQIALITHNKKISFASEKDLNDKLAVTPGSVSILNAVNDLDKSVNYYIDKALFDHKNVAYHPNQNDETIVFDGSKIEDLLKDYPVKIY